MSEPAQNPWRIVAAASLIALFVLSLLWELWLAPLRPGGSMLALKALPLCFAFVGIWKGRRYTFQWVSMLVLFYFTEGVVRAWSERGMSQSLAGLEIALSLTLYLACLQYCRLTRPGRPAD